MASLPKLPGFNFSDPSITRHHLSQTFEICNGYKIPKNQFLSTGGRELDVNSVKYIAKKDPVVYDPTFTYGRTRSIPIPQFIPHWALYSKKALTFKAFFKQSIIESPLEYYRVRHVNIIYFLEDDSMTVMEPRTPNSGIDQGRLIKRGRIPKTDYTYWHWKDLDVGKDIALYGLVFHTIDCDKFTREFMASQGLTMAEPEEAPKDPYTQDLQFKAPMKFTKTPPADDRLRRFLEYDGKILCFKALWDDRDSEHGELRKYELLYFLCDDTVAVKEIYGKNEGRDPFPLLLKRTKIPKVWTDRPSDFPYGYMELTDKEVSEYYQPCDFLVGETIYIFGRKFLIYDCDAFTRNYYRTALCITQKPPIDISDKAKPEPPPKMPPHGGLGSLEDSLQNTLTFLPKPPKKDVIRQILNANKYLRYELRMDVIHPEDEIRRFILFYSLGDGLCRIHEPPIRNSGIKGGPYLKNSYLIKPGSDSLNPDYYTPSDFYIGAIINVFGQRFVITGADLSVYRYMQANPKKFPCDVVENIRNYMFNLGYLEKDVIVQCKDDEDKVQKEIKDSIGKDLVIKPTEMDECLKKFQTNDGDKEADEKKKMDDILQEYEQSLEHKYVVPDHGIQNVNLECPNPVHITDNQ